MNIFLRELKASVKSLLIWSAIVVFFALVGFSKFSAFYQNEEMLQILENMPPALLESFNMNAFNMTEVTGFYGVMFAFYGLILSVAAAMWGSTIISKEERDRTVEFSLTLPVTRARLVTAKALAAAMDCVLLLLVTWGVTVAGAQQYSPEPAFYTFNAISIPAFFILQMIFLALGILLGCALKRHKLAGSLAVGVLLGTYFLSVLSGLSQDLNFLKYFTPFKYFDPLLMLTEGRLEPVFVLLSAGIVIVFMALAYVTYKKRDLYI